jgi:hypothetical protein
VFELIIVGFMIARFSAAPRIIAKVTERNQYTAQSEELIFILFHLIFRRKMF